MGPVAVVVLTDVVAGPMVEMRTITRLDDHPTDGVVEGFSSTGCTGAPTVTIDAGAKCVGFGFTAPSHFKFVQSKSDAGGSCEVADGGPTGGVSVDTATGITLCCIP